MSTVAEGRRGPITAGLMLSTFMIAMDTTVVNVSLPHMQGSLSASPEQITWVLSSFIVAQAVATPISGWLASRVGSKTMLLACMGLFTLSSVLCGMAVNLPQMVLFRVLQGATGAPMGPLAQAVMLNINPPSRIGRAMALFTMAAVLGPILGPVVGGYITDQLSWRWCFYINVPAGILALVLLWLFLPAEPPTRRRFDFLGFSSLALAVGSFQLLLDRGTSQDWFNSLEIWIEAIIAAGGFWVFITHTVTTRNPLFQPGLWRNLNFTTATFLTFPFTMLLYSSVALLPLMMQGVMGYPVIVAGLVSMPRGMTMLLVLQVMGRLDALVDRRLLLAFAFAVMGVSFMQMGQFDLDMSPRLIVIATILQGIGQGVMSVPLSTLALGTLAPNLRADASAFMGMVRNLAGSVGIAAMQALTAFNAQRMHASLTNGVRLDDPVVRAGLGSALSPETVAGAVRLNEEITRQATMVAYVDDFRLMALLTLLSAPMLLLLRQPKRRVGPPEIIEPAGV